MNLRITRRLAMVAMAVAPIATALPATPASAAPSGFLVVVGTAKIPLFPCTPNCGGGTFTTAGATPVGVAGTAIGATTDGRLVTGVTATYNYNEACVGGEPLLGDANGTITLTLSAGANVNVPFAWTRVGLVAVITSNPPTATANVLVGAAVFVPSPLPTCTNAQAINATVAGGGILVSP